MNNSLFSTKDMVKYLIVSGLIYAILKMLPSTQLADKDLILLLAIITVGFICLDCLFVKKQNIEKNTEKFVDNTNQNLIGDNKVMNLPENYNTINTNQFLTSDNKVMNVPDVNLLQHNNNNLNNVCNNSNNNLNNNLNNVCNNSNNNLNNNLNNICNNSNLNNACNNSNNNTNNSNNNSSNQETILIDRKNALREIATAEKEQSEAAKVIETCKDRIINLNKRKDYAELHNSIDEIRVIQEEINLINKTISVSEERIIVAGKLKNNAEKILINTPMTSAEELIIKSERSAIADERIAVAEKRKANAEERKIFAEKNDSIGYLREIEQERKDALNAIIAAHDEKRSINTTYVDSFDKIKTSCGLEVEKIKKQMEEQLSELKQQLKSPDVKIAKKYYDSLMNDLADKGILNDAEIDNIQTKLRSKLLSMDEVITSLEILKKEGKSKNRQENGNVKNDREYSELPSEFYDPIGNKISNKWENEYTILNTNKWQVPMARPPVCINTAPCKVCPSDSSNYPVNLKQWDDSRIITGGKINKNWAADQG